MTSIRQEHDYAQVIALNALHFLASDEDRIQRFLSASGATVETIRAQANDVELHAAVLEHLMNDESLLFQFCESAGLKPQDVASALRALIGQVSNPHD